MSSEEPKPELIIDGNEFATVEEFMKLLLTFCQQLGLYPEDWSVEADTQVLLDEVLLGWFHEDEDGIVTMFSDVLLEEGDEKLELREPTGFILRWRNSAVSEERLAGKLHGDVWRTCYREIVETFREHGPGGERERDGVELVLE